MDISHAMIETFFFKFFSPQQEVRDLKDKLSDLRLQEETKKKLLVQNHQVNGTFDQDSSDESDSNSSSPIQGSFPWSNRCDSSTDNVPSSPLRAHFRAYLPNNQRTMVGFVFNVN